VKYYTLVITLEFPTDEVLDQTLAHWLSSERIDYWRRACPSEPRANIQPEKISIPWAVIHDGNWYEPGEGASFFVDKHSAADDAWEKKVRSIVDGLTDGWLSHLHCHS
jgi:hypothetical protein